MPIFFVGTSPTCPHCVGLPERIRMFSNQVGNKTKILFTNADCSKTSFCKKTGILGVPIVILIRGTDKNYWQMVYGRKPDEWAEYLRMNFGSTAYQTILSEFDINKTILGGTHFHLILNVDDKALLKKYKHMSALYRTYKCTFSYILTTDEKPKLIAYKSHVCSVEFDNLDVNNMESFIRSNLMSSYHKWYMEEFIHEMKTSLVVSYVMEDSRRTDGDKGIQPLLGNSCSDIKFGITAIDTDKWITEISGLKSFTEPYYVGINKKKRCMVRSTASPNDILEDGFLERLREGKDCHKIKMPRDSYISETKVMLYFLVLLLLIGCISFIAMIKICPTENKFE